MRLFVCPHVFVVLSLLFFLFICGLYVFLMKYMLCDRNLDSILSNLQKNFAEGIGYYQLLIKVCVRLSVCLLPMCVVAV